MNLNLVSNISSFCVADLRNSQLLRAIHALIVNILNDNLLHPEQIRDSLILNNLPGLFMGIFFVAIYNYLRNYMYISHGNPTR